MSAVVFDPITQSVSFVPATFTADGGKQVATIYSAHNSLYTVLQTKKSSFYDLKNHWAQADVEFMNSKLLVEGVSNSEFAPDRAVTRAEFATMLVRALAVEQKASGNKFADVDPTAWFSRPVEAAVRARLVEGIDDNLFKPDAPITREQLAVMVSRALKLAGDSANSNSISMAADSFIDKDSISPWAKEAVSQSLDAGIMSGVTDNRMEPLEQTTRAQAATVLKRVLKYLKFVN